MTVQTLLKTGRILPERSALQGDLKADPGAEQPGETLTPPFRHVPGASAQNAPPRQSPEISTETQCETGRWPLSTRTYTAGIRSCHKHKSLHDTTGWEAEGKTRPRHAWVQPRALLRHARACWRPRHTPSSDVLRARSVQQHQAADRQPSPQNPKPGALQTLGGKQQEEPTATNEWPAALAPVTCQPLYHSELRSLSSKNLNIKTLQ